MEEAVLSGSVAQFQPASYVIPVFTIQDSVVRTYFLIPLLFFFPIFIIPSLFIHSLILQKHFF